MPHTVTCQEIDGVRERGREDILSIVAEFRKDMDPLTKQLALKQLYGNRVAPIQKAIENFDTKKFHDRHEDPAILKIILLGSFKAVAEIDTICELMAQNRVDDNTRQHYDTVKQFSDVRKWDLCQAFHTYGTDGKVEPRSASDVLSFLTKLAKKGFFPRDILSGLVFPLKISGPSPDNLS